MKLNDNTHKNNPFKVPDDYFENFYDNLKDKIGKEEIKEPKTFKLNFNLSKERVIKNLKPIISVAAIIIFILLIITNINHYNNDNLAYNTTETEFIYDDMLYSMLYDLDEIIFYELLLNEEEYEENYSDEELDEYISSNVSDYELYSLLQ